MFKVHTDIHIIHAHNLYTFGSKFTGTEAILGGLRLDISKTYNI